MRTLEHSGLLDTVGVALRFVPWPAVRGEGAPGPTGRDCQL